MNHLTTNCHSFTSMWKASHFLGIWTIGLLFLMGCSSAESFTPSEADEAVQVAAEQAEYMLSLTPDTVLNPCTVRADGSVAYINPYDWRSGFFPGSLWYLYALTGQDSWRSAAEPLTLSLDCVKSYTGNHDVGFMMGSSYGNALRFTGSKPQYGYGNGNKEWEDVLVATARSLCARYVPEAGVIRSWGRIGDAPVTVIIDNMMNLELLFEASRLSGDDTFSRIAITHADNTLANHFRPDGSSYHVLEYDATDGHVISKHTHQGLSDESVWSRGQAWAIYGFTMMYRYTKEQKYLDQALQTFSMMQHHANMPADHVPYWDMDAPGEERDASSAAIMASALYEMATYVKPSKGRELRSYAASILHALSSADYRASVGTNGGFLLKHSVGSKPGHSEVDVPLNYADYYYLEAIWRSQQ